MAEVHLNFSFFPFHSKFQLEVYFSRISQFTILDNFFFANFAHFLSFRDLEISIIQKAILRTLMGGGGRVNSGFTTLPYKKQPVNVTSLGNTTGYLSSRALDLLR